MEKCLNFLSSSDRLDEVINKLEEIDNNDSIDTDGKASLGTTKVLFQKYKKSTKLY